MSLEKIPVHLFPLGTSGDISKLYLQIIVSKFISHSEPFISGLVAYKSTFKAW